MHLFDILISKFHVQKLFSSIKDELSLFELRKIA